MRLPQPRIGAWLVFSMAAAFMAFQLSGRAQQAVPFDGGIPVAPAGFEPLPIPAEPIEFDTAEVMRTTGRITPIAMPVMPVRRDQSEQPEPRDRSVS